MDASGFLFLTINGGPVVSVPVTVDTGRIVMELWYGDYDASTADPSVRAVVEGVLTAMTDLQSEHLTSPN